MISAGDFGAMRNECKGVLKKLSLLDEWIKVPSYPNDLPSLMRSKTYREQWEHCEKESLYDAKLSDGSLLQFRRGDHKVSYNLLEVPFAFPKFEDYAFQRLGEEWEDLEEALREEFELAASSEIAEKPATPIRYDYEPELYREGSHPAGHFHFGIGNQIRIGARRVLSPLSFILFVVRQVYPEDWERLKEWPEFPVLSRQVREALPHVEKDFFQGNDHKEVFLS